MATTKKNWWMFHGDPAHTGEVTDSNINSGTVKSLTNTFSLNVPGSVMSTPAIVDGSIYVGLSNAHGPGVPTGIGGILMRIDIETGATLATFNWTIAEDQRDSHSFAGMGTTPAVVDGFVYFIAFNGVLYCLDADDLSWQWQTDLRHNDPAHNQPILNVFPDPPASPSSPQAAGWSSPVVANGNIWLGIGEGENPNLMSFVYCLDAASGDVKWIFCTNRFSATEENQPNVLPAAYCVPNPPPAPFTATDTQPIWTGASVWAGVAYDEALNLIYATTGNPNSPNATAANGWGDPGLPTPNSYAYGILALNATTGALVAFAQMPPESSYRPSDRDIDIGGSPTLYSINGRKVVGAGCKNGSYMICDAQTLEIITWHQMLPKQNGTWIENVDKHGPDIPEDPNPNRTNEQSSTFPPDYNPNNPPYEWWSYENYQGTYSTAAICSSQQKLFIGLGGNNYHYLAPGIFSETTPFIRALKWDTLEDAWPTAGDPAKYTNGSPPLYANAGESGISVPAVVNDVVFMATTLVALYAFNAADGTLLWQDTQNFGAQTGGFSGGYGYCMGPAIWGDYVVAGALVYGGQGGCLNIYKLTTT